MKREKPPSAEEISKAMQMCVEREPKYPTIKMSSLRKMMDKIPEEYNDTDVAFCFILASNNEGFTLGTVELKLMAVHPDQTKVLFCDDAAAEQFFKINPTVSYPDDEE